MYNEIFRTKINILLITKLKIELKFQLNKNIAKVIIF